MSLTVVAIQNPGASEAEVFTTYDVLTAETAAEQYGAKCKQGAFVALTTRDDFGNTLGVSLFVVDRSGDAVYLQRNQFIAEENVDIDSIGSVAGSAYAPEEVPPAELEQFTVYGLDDDRERFTVVVSATESTVEDAARKAAATSDDYTELVTIVAILKGDQSNVETVSI